MTEVGWLTVAGFALAGTGVLAKYFLITPCVAFRAVVVEIDRAEAQYGNVLGNTTTTGERPEMTARREEAAVVLRDLGTRLRAAYNAIPALSRGILLAAGALPRRSALNAAAGALIGLSNGTRPRGNSNDLQENNREREILRANLVLPFKHAPRHVKVTGRWWLRRVMEKPQGSR